MDDDGHEEARALLTLLLNQNMETGDLYRHRRTSSIWPSSTCGPGTGRARSNAPRRASSYDSTSTSRRALYVEAMARACLGDVDEARDLAESGLVEARRAEDVVFRMQNLHVLGFVELSLRNHEAALALLREATDLMRPRWNREFGDCHVVPDEIEALVALGTGAGRGPARRGWTRSPEQPSDLGRWPRCPVPRAGPGGEERPRRGRHDPRTGAGRT